MVPHETSLVPLDPRDADLRDISMLSVHAMSTFKSDRDEWSLGSRNRDLSCSGWS